MIVTMTADLARRHPLPPHCPVLSLRGEQTLAMVLAVNGTLHSLNVTYSAVYYRDMVHHLPIRRVAT